MLGARGIATDALLVVESALKSVGGRKYQGVAERMCVGQRENMAASNNRAAGAGVGDVIETIEAIAAEVLLLVVGAQQVAFAKALVNLDVELIVRRRINAGTKPIAVLESA